MIERHRNLRVEPEDCIVTNGALGALMVSMQVLSDPGDEVIMITPWYFFYPAMCEVLGIKLVGVPSLPGNTPLVLPPNLQHFSGIIRCSPQMTSAFGGGTQKADEC